MVRDGWGNNRFAGNRCAVLSGTRTEGTRHMDSREISELIARRQSELGELWQPPRIGTMSGEPDFESGRFTVTYFAESRAARVAVLSSDELASPGWFALVLSRLGLPAQDSEAER
jgi:hypothetical protein